MLAVVLSKNARARAVQLPAWNEALGLPRPWDQQWSLRMQQILAYETDLLEYGDIFDGSTRDRAQGRGAEGRGAGPNWRAIDAMGGGASAAVDRLHEARLVEANAARLARDRDAARPNVVGVNRFTETEPSPLTGGDGAIMTVTDEAEAEQIARLKAWRAARDGKAVDGRAGRPAHAPRSEGRNIMEPRSPAPRPASPPANGARRCAQVFGEYRAPTGVAPRHADRRPSGAGPICAAASKRVAEQLGETPAASWSASRASTAIPTAPSRSRCAPATAAWRSSTTASA